MEGRHIEIVKAFFAAKKYFDGAGSGTCGQMTLRTGSRETSCSSNRGFF